MAKIIRINQINPQERLLVQVVSILKMQGSRPGIDTFGVIAYPTSSGYALGCMLTNQKGVERIRQIRRLEEKQDFTLMCADISQATSYAKIDDRRFKFIKSLNAEGFTFLLPASPSSPKKTQSKRGTVGIRITTSPVVQGILTTLDEPILSTSLLIPNEDGVSKGHQIHQGFSRGLELKAFNAAWQIEDAIGNLVDGIIELEDSCGESIDAETDPTTVLDLTESEYDIIRQGKGVID